MNNELIKNAIVAFYKFYDHNALVFYLGLLLLVVVIRLIAKPSRYYVLLMIGLSVLVFSFEYQKHLVPHFFSHLLDPIVDPSTHGRTYRYSSLFISQVFPVLLDILGWFMIALAMISPNKLLVNNSGREIEDESESNILKLKSVHTK